MPVFRFDKALGIARGAKALLNNSRSSDDTTLGTLGTGRQESPAGDQAEAWRPTPEQERMLESKRRELSLLKTQYRAAKSGAESIRLKRRKKSIKQEIFVLESELRAATEQRAEGEPATGALPDFVVIGAQKGGTTFLYHLLVQHPYVEPAASKEVHFFDNLFDLGVEWYRWRFPAPRRKDGRRTITGEATPYYLFHPHAAKRMAQVIPRARLIVLLRNPVDRAYSHHQMAVRNAVRRGENPRKFEEALEVEAAKLRGERNKMLEDERHDSFEHQRFSYLSRGVYVDQLLRWSEFFPKEQMLVLKSEDLFECPAPTLKLVEDFLELPDWQPEALEPRDGRDLDKYKRIKRNKGRYEEEMDPTTRRRLEEYFEPHNQRLYEFLGADFGW